MHTPGRPSDLPAPAPGCPHVLVCFGLGAYFLMFPGVLPHFTEGYIGGSCGDAGIYMHAAARGSFAGRRSASMPARSVYKIKSGRERDAKGLEAFHARYPRAATRLLSLEDVQEELGREAEA